MFSVFISYICSISSFFLCWKYWNLERKARCGLHKSPNKRKTPVLPNCNLKLCSVWGWKAPPTSLIQLPQCLIPARVSWRGLLRAVPTGVWRMETVSEGVAFLMFKYNLLYFSMCLQSCHWHFWEESGSCLYSSISCLYTLIKSLWAFLGSSWGP